MIRVSDSRRSGVESRAGEGLKGEGNVNVAGVESEACGQGGPGTGPMHRDAASIHTRYVDQCVECCARCIASRRRAMLRGEWIGDADCADAVLRCQRHGDPLRSQRTADDEGTAVEGKDNRECTRGIARAPHQRVASRDLSGLHVHVIAWPPWCGSTVLRHVARRQRAHRGDIAVVDVRRGVGGKPLGDLGIDSACHPSRMAGAVGSR